MGAVMPDRLGLGLFYDGWPRYWVFRNVDRTPADDCSSTCAGAEFRKSHLYRHDKHPV